MPSSLTGMIDVVVNTTAQEQRDAAAKNFASVANTLGPLALVQDGAVDRLLTLCQASGKAGASEREAAAAICAELAAVNNAALNAILISKLGSAIKQLLGDKSRRAANTAKQTLGTMFSNISLDHGYSALYLLIDTQNQPWPALQWQMEMLAPWAEGSMAPVINHALREIMPVIADLMWHDKDAVKSAAAKALELVMRTVTNKDVEPFLPSVAETILHPDSVDACLERLASTTFVAEVKGDALAVMEPLLTRGLQLQRHTATKRQAARIIESMVKLVDDPREVEPFVPKLLPALEKAKDTVPDPECREVCTKAYDQLVLCLSKEHGKALDKEYVMSLVANDKMDKDLSRFVAGVIQSLAADIHNEPKWVAALEPLMALLGVSDKEQLAPLVHDLRTKVSHYVAVEAEEEEDDDKELLCDCEFSLAFGSKILLNLTRLKLIRGARYGLCGKNDCGKTSLMRAISRNQLEGFPDPSTVRTVFVETEIQGELSDLSVLDYIFADPLLRNCGVTREEMSATLISVGFGLDGPASIDKQVGRLSGGWKMKLALARAMLLKADILLLDEPTNHLDTKNRQWVEEYLQSLTNVTSIMVSHDSGFLDRVCSHILHIDNLKIKAYRGNLTAFVEQVPEAKAYFELQASKYKFKFPMPGPLEGIKSKGRHILKMSNVTFTYPGAAKAQLNNVSVRVSLSSRVACVGPNGAGKSTMIKLLTGELLPDEGFAGTEVWKHPNCRVAYVAQHAFHHIESHLEKTPNEYIRWRYQYGVDKEALKKQNMQETEEEKLKQKEPVMVEVTDAEGNKKREKRVIKELTNGRRQEHKGRRNEYEVLLVGGNDQRVWMLETQLAQMGFEKGMKEVDERISSMAAGFNRPLSSAFVETHLMDVGLEREFATHTNIRALSGGQKVKVVLAAALWKCPHIIIIDEPTNYLDRESLGALAEAIKEFEGGVVIVSHNNEFCEACCPETWVLENHTLNIKGDPEWLAAAEKELVKTVEEDDEDLKDAFGNTIQRKKKATRQDMKKLKKKIEQLRKAGEEVWTDEELEKMGLEAPTD